MNSNYNITNSIVRSMKITSNIRVTYSMEDHIMKTCMLTMERYREWRINGSSYKKAKHVIRYILEHTDERYTISYKDIYEDEINLIMIDLPNIGSSVELIGVIGSLWKMITVTRIGSDTDDDLKLRIISHLKNGFTYNNTRKIDIIIKAIERESSCVTLKNEKSGYIVNIIHREDTYLIRDVYPDNRSITIDLSLTNVLRDHIERYINEGFFL